uniref:Uncharacterized protein n=1 Tax=Anguilla anguilla TaxID=7936 RepID=A0A0E9UFB2_ANGAN
MQLIPYAKSCLISALDCLVRCRLGSAGHQQTPPVIQLV